ncbi:LutC/YkgG family protein [Fodinicurvata sediminis]|uniref:LutC/YkgG family protein n=1 Tax=Fodinicurvata sediminis TaxID=1121832 RepID=UPI0003B6ECB4|nr:LUD domain-containing protein [Fodinicurvata sediminis]
MTDSRARILDQIRRSRAAVQDDVVDHRLAEHPRGPIPARAQLSAEERLALFIQQATAVDATVSRLQAVQEIPQAVASYLRERNLPATLRMAPDRKLIDLPWTSQASGLEVQAGCVEATDAVSLVPAFAAVAETGTLILHSGAERPTGLNFLPDTHIVMLEARDITGTYEQVWDRLRAQNDGRLPRTVNMITGPSRTADIEQTIQLGAHGPRRLHILVVGDPED